MFNRFTERARKVCFGASQSFYPQTSLKVFILSEAKRKIIGGDNV